MQCVIMTCVLLASESMVSVVLLIVPMLNVIYAKCQYADTYILSVIMLLCCYAEYHCRVSIASFMLSATKPNVITPNAIMPNVNMTNVSILNVKMPNVIMSIVTMTHVILLHVIICWSLCCMSFC